MKTKSVMKKATKGFLMIGGIIFWPVFAYGFIKSCLKDK